MTSLRKHYKVDDSSELFVAEVVTTIRTYYANFVRENERAHCGYLALNHLTTSHIMSMTVKHREMITVSYKKLIRR